MASIKPVTIYQYIHIIYLLITSYFTLNFLKLFDQTRLIVSLIFLSYPKITPFLLIFLFFILIFSLVWHQLSYSNFDSSDDLSFMSSLKYSTNLALGVWDTESYRAEEWMVFLVGNVTLSLIMLNILVGIIGDVWESGKGPEGERRDLEVKLGYLKIWYRVKKDFIYLMSMIGLGIVDKEKVVASVDEKVLGKMNFWERERSYGKLLLIVKNLEDEFSEEYDSNGIN